MTYIFILMLFSFSIFAQKQRLDPKLFSKGIIEDACGVEEKTADEQIKVYGKPLEKDVNNVPHGEDTNIAVTYSWSFLKTGLYTVPQSKNNVEKTSIIYAEVKKSLPKQMVKVGQGREEIEKKFGVLDPKLNPSSSNIIEFDIGDDRSIGPETLKYSIDKKKIRIIECVTYFH